MDDLIPKIIKDRNGISRTVYVRPDHKRFGAAAKTISAVAMLPLVALGVAGCTPTQDATPPEHTPTGNSQSTETPKATPSAEPTKEATVTPPAPVTKDPVAQAQKASGLTTEQYQKVTNTASSILLTGDYAIAKAEFTKLSSQYGKPVSMIGFVICGPDSANPGAKSWGIAGALSSPTVGCGVSDFQESQAGALAKAKSNAAQQGLKEGDYILVFEQ